MFIDVLHIGDYKTGTTWLQKHGFRQHPEIEYLGDPIGKFDVELNHLVYQLIDSRDIDFNATKLKETLFNIAKKHRFSDERIVLLSREALSSTNYITGENALRNAVRIKEVFGDIKIVFILREQFSMLASIYSQYIKMGGTLKSKDFFLDPYECRGLLERLKYHKTVDAYIDIFGRDNVYIDMYERFKEDKSGFLRGLYSFIGCKDVDFLPVEEAPTVNKSLTKGGATIARLCNYFVRSPRHNPGSALVPVDKIISSLISSEKKAAYIKYTEQTIIPSYGSLDSDERILYAINSMLLEKIRKVTEKINFGGPVVLPPSLKLKLEDEFKESNKILEIKYSLPIRKYGWSL